MKKSLIGVLTVLALVCHAEWKQCRNCGKEFKGDSIIGYDYCRKNACQKVRNKEDKAKFQSALSSHRQLENKKQKNQRHAKDIAIFLKNAKKNNIPVSKQVEQIVKVLIKTSDKLLVWELVIASADMEVIKLCWPSPNNEEVFKRSSKIEELCEQKAKNHILFGASYKPNFISEDFFAWSRYKYDHLSSINGSRYENGGIDNPKMPHVSFALGRHKKTNKIRYVEKSLEHFSIYHLYKAVSYGRYDVLDWFLSQMQGLDVTEFCLLVGVLEDELNSLNKDKNKIKTEIAKVKSLKTNAADKYQEEKYSKQIAALEKKLAEQPDLPKNYKKILDVMSKHTNDELFQKIVKKIDALNTASRLAIVIDWLKADSRGKKVMDLYKTLGVFSWKANLPNRQRIGVYSDQKENTWKAAPGFELSKDGKAVWKAGLPHPQYEGLISAKEIFTWIPDAKHAWKNPAAAEDLSTQEDLDPVSNFLIKTEKRSQHNYRSY